MGYPFVKQRDGMQCGIACIASVCRHYGMAYPVDFLEDYCQATSEGVSMKGIEDCLDILGFDTRAGMVDAGVVSTDYLFLDEATNSLDAKNEREIVERLNEFYRNRTVVVVAHRLSTVRNADHIIVVHEGRIVEAGTHDELAGKKGYYYNLVKNQLELGT